MFEVFKTGASFCTDQDGNLVTDIKSLLDLWWAHFNSILNGYGTNNSANEMIRFSKPNTGAYDGTRSCTIYTMTST